MNNVWPNMYYCQRRCWRNCLFDTFSSCHLVFFEGKSYFWIRNSRDQALSGQRTATVRVHVHVWLSDESKRPDSSFIILNFLNQIRKKRQQGGVYNPQEMENKDYKRKGNIDINSISMQVQPERLIWSNYFYDDFHG